MRDITCPEDLDRLPACPSCQQLSRDLAAALQRAEQAEAEVARLRRAVEEMARRRVYLLFAGTRHPRGGGYDLVGIFGTLDEAKAAWWDGNWASIFRFDGRALDPVCDAGTQGWERDVRVDTEAGEAR